VLIVEDEPALLRALRIDLRARGYDVALASAGREALAQARQRPPDVVLLDLGLPDVDGTEVIRDLRGWYQAPVIVLSGRDDRPARRPSGRAAASNAHRVAAARGLAHTPGSWSASIACSVRSGDRGSSAVPTTSGSTWPGCDASWRKIRTARGTC
jgi:CheY-like chemotaxis protein